MATDIASKEPTQIRAGDTIEWKRSIDDYKASDQLDAEIYLFRQGVSKNSADLIGKWLMLYR